MIYIQSNKHKLILIAAVAENRCIGHNNTLLWKLKRDMQFFRTNTLGHTVVMGRRTWESLGRPLPKRRNIVLSRQTNLSFQGVEVFSSLEDFLKTCTNQDKVFIIGGAQIYEQALPYVDELLITEVHTTKQGDTFFPVINNSIFEEVDRKLYLADSENEYAFDFVRYIRKFSL